MSTDTPTPAPYLLGAARRDITVYEPGQGLLGWSMFDNRAEAVATPLYARAYAIQDAATGARLVFVNCELSMITLSLRQGVMERLAAVYPHLGYTEHNVMITAQHTHSAPGGYSHYLILNTTIPGYIHRVWETLVHEITETIAEAHAAMRPGNLHYGEGSFDRTIPVAFNRSYKAYNQNPEVEPVEHETRNEALDRTMRLLRLDGADGSSIGSFNFFGVHTTSIHNDYNQVCSDNKGHAATLLEDHIQQQAGGAGHIAAFAQATTGDVTPNYVYHPEDKRGFLRGPYMDDFESMRENGRFQFHKALEIWQQAASSQALPPRIDSLLWYVDMTKVELLPEFANGKFGQRTGKHVMGVAFGQGTDEGPGLPEGVAAVVRTYCRMRGLFDKEIHGNKYFFIQPYDRKILGISDLNSVPLKDWMHPGLQVLRKWQRNGAWDQQPLTPHILPLQIFIIGNMAIAALPCEPTTIAGRRIKNTVQEVLGPDGIDTVICIGYANAYAGYTTTYEEYELQCYEGGHTPFGKWTGAAYQQTFRSMAQQLRLPAGQRAENTLRPYRFTLKELALRAYDPEEARKMAEERGPLASLFPR